MNAQAEPGAEGRSDDGRDLGQWHENNQRALVSEMDRVRSRVRRHAAIRAGGEEDVREAAPREEHGDSAVGSPVAESSLSHLMVVLGLSEFERDTLLLCAGMELAAGFAADCAAAHGDLSRGYPTFGLAMAALDGPHWSMLSPDGPLRRWGLIEIVDGPDALSLVASRLRISEWALHLLTGIPTIAPSLTGFIERFDEDVSLTPSQDAAADRLVAGWDGLHGEPRPMVELIGREPTSVRSVAAAVCRRIGRQGYILRSLPIDPERLPAFLCTWEREIAVRRAVAAIDLFDETMADPTRLVILDRWISRLDGPRMILGRHRHPFRAIDLVVEVPPVVLSDRIGVWQTAAGAGVSDAEIERLADQFRLDPGSIREAAAEAGLRPEGMPIGRALWQACRVRARPRLDDLAVRIEPLARWEDIVLPEEPMRLLREIALSVRQRCRVQETWGFGARTDRGLGLAALFTGPSGVGKTMAAEVLANELELDLFRIDLSQVVSKYIGETEKNLRRVFDAAEAGGVILLFDEADALFGRRGEVKDSHDRYANMEVGYLLQRMETYHGLAILTTNLKESIDPAFYRRLRFVVAFEPPDVASRARIWRRVFPEATPRTELDWDTLARLKVMGGQIQNMALHAASLAAEAGEAIGMDHLLRAAQVEYAKHDRHLSETERAGWPGRRGSPA